MALPILETPMHSCVLPSTNERVEFRPFLVGEQKVLMIAQESDDQKTQVREMIRLINTCCEEVDANKLVTTDLEYLFLQIRIKSVGETSDVTMKCTKCETENTIEVDLETAEIKQDKKVSNIIKLNGEVSIELKHPTYESVEDLEIKEDETNTKDAFKLMNRCIVAVVNGDEVMTRDDFRVKELDAFIASMNMDMFESVQDYLASAPILSIAFEFKCSNCENQEKGVLEGIGSFFD